MYLRSKYLLPISSPPIRDGVLHIEGGFIKNIGGTELLKNIRQESITDLSQHVILPGFVNTHCHLELTALGSLLPDSKVSIGNDTFTPWIHQIISKKTDLDEYLLVKGYQEGLTKLITSGVTTLLDHISFNTPLTCLDQSKIRVLPNIEVLGAHPEIAMDIYQAAKTLRSNYQSTNPGKPFFISPHSIHALHPDILKLLLDEISGPLFIHLAESEAEESYFKNHSGGIAQLITDRGLNPPAIHRESGLSVLNQLTSTLDRICIVHGNYLSKYDLALMARYQIPVIHCPGSHNYFSHQDFALDELINQNILVALGTDSLASNHDLNFLSELKLFSKQHPTIAQKDILRMATLNGAKALRMDQQIGTLEIGKLADLAVFEMSTEDPIESVFKADRADRVFLEGQQIA